MISSFFGTFILFQDKEKEQGLSSKIIMSKKEKGLPKISAKHKRNGGKYPSLEWLVAMVIIPLYVTPLLGSSVWWHCYWRSLPGYLNSIQSH